MTEPTTESTEPATEPETTEPDGSTEAEPERGKGGNAEAARYRIQLRTAEAERDALTATVTRLQTAAAERVAGEWLAAPADLWAFGGSLADLLDDHGDVDPDRVAGQVAALLDQRPGLAKGARVPVVELGQGTRQSTAGGASWQGLLQGRR